MNLFKLLTASFFVIFMISCSDDGTEPVASDADLIKLELKAGSVTHSTVIIDNSITLQEILLYGTETVTIHSIEISPGATSEKKAGDILQIEQSPITIEITAEDGTKNSYSLELEVESYSDLLFGRPTEYSCEPYAVINFGEMNMNMNMWYALNYLTEETYSQCIYLYEDEGSSLFGWNWSYPENELHINGSVYVIYGWNPYSNESTTSNLPVRISDFSEMKINYDAIIDANDGNYLLSFNNWISYSPSVDLPSIEFDFEIWEKTQNLAPSQDYQADVTTTNGVYKFYMGAPGWIPHEADWKVLTFVRSEGRQSGIVDIDELLEYLVNEGIVSSDSYLASIEFGNELCNTTGSCIVKEFEVVIE